MLIRSEGNCDKCGTTNLPSTEQEARVTCKKCGEKFKMCISCKANGCPKCGGKLESQMEWAQKNGVLF